MAGTQTCECLDQVKPGGLGWVTNAKNTEKKGISCAINGKYGTVSSFKSLPAFPC